jgi:hypothetical protein
MTCDEVRERLDDFIDAVLAPTDARAVAEHLRGCASCRAEADGLRNLLAGARALGRGIEPARDLWPAIERQIAAGTVRRGRFGWWPGAALGGHALLAAAALLVAVLGTVVGLLVLRESRRGPAAPGAVDATAVTLAGAPAGEANAAEQFTRARAELRAALEARRAELSPATVEVIDRNLAVIERAAAEIETAMGDDPGNQHLRGLLLAVYRQEIELLLRAAKLPAAS